MHFRFRCHLLRPLKLIFDSRGIAFSIGGTQMFTILYSLFLLIDCLLGYILAQLCLSC